MENECKNKEVKVNYKMPFSESEMEVKKKYYLLINKMFVQKYGVNFAVLLAELDRLTYSVEAFRDEEGYTLITHKLFKSDIHLSKEQVNPLIKKMEKLGLVETKYTHDGRRKYYRVNRGKVVAHLKQLIAIYEDKKRKKKK